MTYSSRPAVLLGFFAVVVILASPLFASPPTALEMDTSGLISIRTGDWGDMQIRPDIADTSTGTWKNLNSKQPFVSDAGNEIKREGVYIFPDGTEVMHTTTATINGDTVEVKAEWPTESSASGFTRVDLWFPIDMAEDLTVEAEGKVVTTNMDKTSPPIRNISEVVFRQTSTGKFICRLTSDFLDFSTFFLDAQPQQGMWIRIANVPDANTSTISDVTSTAWNLSFTE